MQPNQEPTKWRDGIDPFELPLKNVRMLEVLGYPHAGNQVFYFRGSEAGTEGFYYLKYAAHADANLRNEVDILRRLRHPLAPRLVDFDDAEGRWAVTAQQPGKRLSVITAQEGRTQAMTEMPEYGRTLALLHESHGNFPDAPRRSFHDLQEPAWYRARGLDAVGDFLLAHQPQQRQRCFVHGDGHYANLLWTEGRISGILDFELSGMGDPAFDIAWVLAVRPGQRFLHTEEERLCFLAGYEAVRPCDVQQVRYCMALIYPRFLKAGDDEYEAFVRSQLQQLTHG